MPSCSGSSRSGRCWRRRSVWLPAISSVLPEGERGIAEHGGNYIVVTDATGQQRLISSAIWRSAAASCALRQTAAGVRHRRTVISRFFRCSRYRQSADHPWKCGICEWKRFIYSRQWASLSIALAIFCAAKSPPTDHGDLRCNGTIAARTHKPEQYVGGKGSAASCERQPRSARASRGQLAEGVPVLSAFNRSCRSGWAIGIGIPKTALTENLWRSMAQRRRTPRAARMSIGWRESSASEFNRSSDPSTALRSERRISVNSG